jgi:4-hydroxy-tetrahydrodipicolinate reductase
MGRVITDIVKEDMSAEIVAGVDVVGDGTLGYPVYKSISEVPVEADAIIDFSSPKVLEGLLEYAEKTNTPVVLCTTGFSPEQLENIKTASAKVAILKSANMSLGINTIIKMLKTATSVFCPAGFDVEIVEQHHHNKLDAPSGTALALADACNEALEEDYEYCYGRADRREKRPKNEIGISAVRGGNIVGEHEVIFAGLDEVITIKHTAYSKSVFAKGAVEAAKFLAGKPAGLYDMKQVIAEK